MENVFRKWDRVYHFVYGWGNIVNDEFPLEVEFDNRKGPYRDFFKDGYLLSFTEYELEGFSQERPEVLPEEGQVVWVRNNSISDWEVTHFMYHEYSQYYVSSTCDEDNTKSFLYMTTKNPYADEQ